MNSALGKKRSTTRRQHTENTIARALAKTPAEQQKLKYERDTQSVLNGMIREWEEIFGGSFECRPAGSRWAHLSDDSWVIGSYRPLGLSTDLCAISDHATARTLASGYREAIVGNVPPVAYWSTITTLEDTIPVMLAVLDRELTGAVGFLNWYLQTPCHPQLCRHHPGDSETAFCGSPSCASASPDTPCDCICGGVNHGMGEDGAQPWIPKAPDWSSAPAPVW